MPKNRTSSADCTKTYLNLFEMFDKAGVPPEMRWRSLLLFFREMKDYHYLDQDQKIALLAQMEDILKTKTTPKSIWFPPFAGAAKFSASPL